MSGMIDQVDRRTQLAGHNRLEILTFFLTDRKQRFGINVFKVQEVIQCPPLNKIPKSNPMIKGVADIRGKTMPVIDLAMAIGMQPVPEEEIRESFLIVAEYNRAVQAFLVSGVDRIVNMNWEDIKAPPKGIGRGSYLTAVTEVDDQFIEIIDVEKVFSEVIVISTSISAEISEASHNVEVDDRFIMIVDDSMVARNQIKRPLEEMGIGYVMAKDGREALDMLLGWVKDEPGKINKIPIIISDVEMPNMDGYTLVTEIRKHPALKNLYVILHSSLSGIFNKAMIEKVGANEFVAKYDPNLLSESVLNKMHELQVNNS